LSSLNLEFETLASFLIGAIAETLNWLTAILMLAQLKILQINIALTASFKAKN
jgi:hypothetical protein